MKRDTPAKASIRAGAWREAAGFARERGFVDLREYDRLMEMADTIEHTGLSWEEIEAAGTPAAGLSECESDADETVCDDCAKGWAFEDGENVPCGHWCCYTTCIDRHRERCTEPECEQERRNAELKGPTA